MPKKTDKKKPQRLDVCYICGEADCSGPRTDDGPWACIYPHCQDDMTEDDEYCLGPCS